MYTLLKKLSGSGNPPLEKCPGFATIENAN